MNTKPGARQATLADVALEAGVSKMTVSKVLRGTGSISAPTRNRVLRAVAELGYVKNALAGQLRSQTSSIVAVVIPSVSDMVFAEIFSGINSIIRPNGLTTLIAESLFDPEVEHDALSRMISMQPAGLIISGGVVRSPATLALLEQRRCPLISVWDIDARLGDKTIGLSHTSAGESMAEHFLARGFATVGYVGSQLHLDICARKRLDGFERRLNSAGRQVAKSLDDALPRLAEGGRVLTERLLERSPRVSAIFYLNDAMAAGGLSWLYENGFQVPSRVAVAGFNGTSIGQMIQTRLTTLEIPRRDIGRSAASAIQALLHGDEVAPRETVEVQLIVGSTT